MQCLSDTTNKTKVYDLIETASGISVTLDSLEACHCLRLQPLSIITKRSILGVATVLDLPHGQMKIRIEPEGAVSQITHITGLQKLFPIISV